MADERFDMLYNGALRDFLDDGAVSSSYTVEISDFVGNSGKMTISDKSDGVLDDNSSDQRLESAEFANGVTVDYGGPNKNNFDVEEKVTFSWEDGDATKFVTVWLIDHEQDGGDPWVVVEDGQDFPPPGTEITITERDTDFVSPFEGVAYADLVCFTRGTMILTERGEVAVEALRADDMVVTRDRGLQPIRWVGSRTVAAKGAAAPILIKAGALANDRDLLVSPNHRMLVEGWKAEALFGEQEVLATARQLTLRDDVHVVEGGEVEYFHILFDRHEIITANGAPSESLNPGEAAKGALADEARAEVLRLFPELENVGEVALVRPMVKDGEAGLIS